MDLLDLMVKVGVDDQASKGVDSLSTNIKGKLATAAKVGAAAVAAVGAAGTAAAVKLVDTAKGVAEYGDNIDKMSQKMGMSAEAYQEWDAVMQHSGTSMEAMKAGMKTLANAAETGSDAFEKLGISQEEIASMSQEQLFERTISALQNVGNETERTYLAGQVLGRGATELGALLNTSAEDTQAMRDRVHELGGVMSDEAVKASAAFQDSLQDMQSAMTGIKNAFIAELLPGMTGVMDGIQEILIGNTDEGIAKVEQGVEAVITGISEKGPVLLEALGAIGSAVMSAILSYFSDHGDEMLQAATDFLFNALKALTDTTPKVMDGLGKLLGQIIATFPEWGPELLKVAVLLFVNILQGIIDMTVAILEGVGNLIGSIVATVTGFDGNMLEAAQELWHNFCNGVDNMRETVVNGFWGIVNGAIDNLTGFANDAYNVGSNILQGIVNGINSAPGAILDAIWGNVDNAIQTVKGWLGIASPSKLFAEMGRYTMQGFALGIEDETEAPEKAMLDAAQSIYGAASGSVDFGMETSKLAASGQYGALGGVQIIINDPVITKEADVDEILAYAEAKIRRRVGQWNPSLSMALS